MKTYTAPQVREAETLFPRRASPWTELASAGLAAEALAPQRSAAKT